MADASDDGGMRPTCSRCHERLREGEQEHVFRMVVDGVQGPASAPMCPRCYALALDKIRNLMLRHQVGAQN